ncbi:MAG: DUF4134 family protein [Bacteroidota bacterium]
MKSQLLQKLVNESTKSIGDSMCPLKNKTHHIKKRKILMATISGLLLSKVAVAQNDIASGAAALDSLTGDLEAYLDPVTTVVYIIAAILGIIGAIRVYSGWQAGKENAWAAASLWVGACLFLLIANTLLRAFFV